MENDYIRAKDVGRLEGQMDGVLTRLSGLDGRITHLEAMSHDTHTKLDTITAMIQDDRRPSGGEKNTATRVKVAGGGAALFGVIGWLWARFGH